MVSVLVARLKYCLFSLLVGWLMGVRSDLEGILKKLEFRKTESREGKQRIVAEAISTYLGRHPILLGLDLAVVVTGRRSASYFNGYSLCLPSQNGYIKFSRDFKLMKLSDAMEKFMHDEVSGAEIVFHSPENRGTRTARSYGNTFKVKRGAKYRHSINIFYRREADVREYIKGRLKLAKKILHYEFTP